MKDIEDVEDCTSVFVFIPDTVRPSYELHPTDSIVLVWNKARSSGNGRPGKHAGIGMPGGHKKDTDEWYIDTGYREGYEEANILAEQVNIIDHRKLFYSEEKFNREQNGGKTHWVFTLYGKLLVPASKIILKSNTHDIEKVEWCRLDQLPSGLYGNHMKRIDYFTNMLLNKGVDH